MAQNRKDNYQDNDFVEKNEPFKNDLLDRAKIAQLWQDTLLKSGKHFVMAVDASWGMGKTYFARNWECKLLHDDYKVCYIDAFKYDFTDDPFMTITSNLIEAFEFTELEEVSNKLNTFFRAFKGHLGAAVPALVGGVVKLVSGIPYVDGVAEIAGSLTNAASNAVKDAKNKNMNPADEVLQSDLSYNAAMTQFKDKLKKLIEKQNSNKPFIVIVDELDRCKPTFAIEFLEKLKHLFDIDNMIFILFMNEGELAKAISHTYGVKGEDYLGKFINFKIELKNKNEKLETSKIMNFIESKFHFDNIRIEPVVDELIKNSQSNPIHSLVILLYEELHMSFRDIINLHIFCEFISDFVEDEYNFAFLIILKAFQMTHNDVYTQLLNIEDIRKFNLSNVEKKYISLPFLMRYSDDRSQNQYIQVFSFLWENIHSAKNILIKDNVDNQLYSLPNDNSIFILLKKEWLTRFKTIAEKMNVKTYHQYIDKLILYINLDIPEIEESQGEKLSE